MGSLLNCNKKSKVRILEKIGCGPNTTCLPTVHRLQNPTLIPEGNAFSSMMDTFINNWPTLHTKENRVKTEKMEQGGHSNSYSKFQYIQVHFQVHFNDFQVYDCKYISTIQYIYLYIWNDFT